IFEEFREDESSSENININNSGMVNSSTNYLINEIFGRNHLQIPTISIKDKKDNPILYSLKLHRSLKSVLVHKFGEIKDDKAPFDCTYETTILGYKTADINDPRLLKGKNIALFKLYT